jgi:hypothetical protein
MDTNASLHPVASYTHRPVQLVLVRANAPLFYSLTAASLLESGMPLAADRLLHFFGSDQTLGQWIRTEWLPRKMTRAAQMREYITAMWPEYDWTAGHEQYHAATEAEGGTGPHRPTGVHEALARCVATAQSGIFYRTLARWAEDPRLRELARTMAEEEALSFGHFRSLYDRRLRVQGLGCTAAWTTALACVRTSRDSQVPRAFNAINAQCAAHTPFPLLEYPEFVARMGSVIERHANLGTPERVLFRTWKARPRLRLAPAAEQRTFGRFTPVLKAAA